MQVTREGDYAVRCVLELAKSGRMSTMEVARRQGVSAPFLGKIVRSLARAGILTTRRGVGGGINLARTADTVTLLQVIEAVQGPLRINACTGARGQCDRVQECPAHSVCQEAQHELERILGVSFVELLARGDGLLSTDGDLAADVGPTLVAAGRSKGVAREAI